MKKRRRKGSQQVETLIHDEARRKNIPTAELQSAAQRAEEINPFKPIIYLRENPLPRGESRPRDEDLDPQIVWKGATLRLSPDQIAQLTETGRLEIGDAQLVWRGKDQQDWSDLIVQAPPLYIQEKIHPKVIIEDLRRQTKDRRDADAQMPDLFANFNGIDPDAKAEFYQHDQNWQNRMILGDSLQVMASLAEREGLRGQVQCIYFDPPYGIKFNSNWQVSTRSRDVKDGKLDQITREPEQVKAFRDTWKDGIHTYLTYLRDRLTAMRDLLTENGSIFVQIGDENVHRVRALMDEVFGDDNFVSLIAFTKGAAGLEASGRLAARLDYIIWFGKSAAIKYRALYTIKNADDDPNFAWVEKPSGKLVRKSQASDFDRKSGRLAQDVSLTKPGPGAKYEIEYRGQSYISGNRWWGTTKPQLERAIKSGRIIRIGNSLRHLRYLEESGLTAYGNLWDGFLGQHAPVYVVQTNTQIVQRCLLMATDPGDLVLDPTCGSGTTAFVAELWGRRWVTIDTSRVSLALARTRLMGAQYPYFFLSDSKDGREKEQEISGIIQSDTLTRGDLRNGFVYERAAHVTLKSIANNAEIDVIWATYQKKLEPLRERLNADVGKSWEEWEIPDQADAGWSDAIRALHTEWWEIHNARKREMDTSIVQKANVEFLYDRPHEDVSKVRVTGPFTVESLSPHRVVPADEAELTEERANKAGRWEQKDAPLSDFTSIVLENLKSAGVHQAAKEHRITFTDMAGWPGTYIAGEAHIIERETKKRAAIFIGPEFGTVTRVDLTAAARESLDARFDTLIACGFNFDAHTSELTRLGPLPILKAKMNPELYMSAELKNTGAGNLFVVFGEPDIQWNFDADGRIIIEVLGIDVFDPKTGEVRASGKDDIAAWFIDTNYNEESFFVRHAYFLGANDPYRSLKTSLKTEIDETAWETLYRENSRPFTRPQTGRFAVKVINHFGDEVMKVFTV